MKPVVGILCCGFDGKNQFVTDTYFRRNPPADTDSSSGLPDQLLS